MSNLLSFVERQAELAGEDVKTKTGATSVVIVMSGFPDPSLGTVISGSGSSLMQDTIVEALSRLGKQ